MMSGMYAAISGLDAHQTMLDVTANNLANVDTVGYKAQSTQFSDQLSQLIQAGTGPNGFSSGIMTITAARLGDFARVFDAAFIGAHALISDSTLITRDAARYRTYFPGIMLIAPN